MVNVQWVRCAVLPKHPQHPTLPAFTRVGGDQLHQLLACKGLEVAHDLAQAAVGRCRDLMQMVRHDHELIQPQALVLTAIRQVLQQKLGILPPREHIHPTHYHERNEVCMAFHELVAFAHGGERSD